MPAVSVAPERDTPGTSAQACAKPMMTPSRAVNVSISRECEPAFSAASSSRPSAISVQPISVRLRAPFSIWSENTSPKIPIGIVPRTM